MADQKVNELTTQTPSLTDFLLGIGASAGSTEYKMVINDLAKAIIEQYTGSTVAGSAQSIKAALDALNSNTDVSEGVISQVESNTVIAKNIQKIGRVVIVYILFKATESIPNFTILFTGLPRELIAALSNDIISGIPCDVESGGAILNQRPINANTTVRISMVYITK